MGVTITQMQTNNKSRTNRIYYLLASTNTLAESTTKSTTDGHNISDGF